MRVDYETDPLKLEDMKASPFEQFTTWMDKAMQVEKGVEVNAMSLATVDSEGWPNNRIVLLKDISKGGFVFFTNYNSSKGKDLGGSGGKSAICFYWPTVNYQIRIRGVCEMVDGAESDAYFNQRPIKARVSAAISPQSEIIPGYDVLESKVNEMLAKIDGGYDLTRPGSWGGYRLIPEKFEFWQGSRSRLHHRFVYEKSGESIKGKVNWKLFQIAP